MIGRIVIGGAIAQKPHSGGNAWQFLQYLHGFRRLGWDVLFVDHLGADGLRDARGRRCTVADAVGVKYLANVMRDAGFSDCWTLTLDGGSHLGLSRPRTLSRVASADLLINVMGHITDQDILDAAPFRAFLDTDPGFTQMRSVLGLADILDGHDAFITVGELIGEPDCTIPDCGLSWITTPQPVVLDQWPATPPPLSPRFTSVASWRGAYDPIDYQGHRYGLRADQLRRFANLPRLAGSGFELALDIDPTERIEAELLRGGGWSLIDPASVASSPAAYQSYIQESFAEIMVAKGMDVDSRGGWMSGRSVCYLASGRPVLAQETGISGSYPVGEGLMTFSTIEEAIEGARAIRGARVRHSQAARELAEEHFHSDRVLNRMLDELERA